MEKSELIHKFTVDLLSLGVRPGGVLLVHPALSPFGHVPGGAETIIAGLLQVLGKTGTLLMPSLSWENVTPTHPVFNLRYTPSCVGAIAEAFRIREGTHRSLHPTHSVCAVGKHANEMIKPHKMDNTPCGLNSPFHLLPKFNGQILMLACDLIYNTSMHAIEELIEPPYLYDPPIIYTLTDENNHTFKKMYRPHNFVNWIQRYERISRILSQPDLRTGMVVNTQTHLIEARALWKAILPVYQNDPLFFVDQAV